MDDVFRRRSPSANVDVLFLKLITMLLTLAVVAKMPFLLTSAVRVVLLFLEKNKLSQFLKDHKLAFGEWLKIDMITPIIVTHCEGYVKEYFRSSLMEVSPPQPKHAESSLTQSVSQSVSRLVMSC